MSTSVYSEHPVMFKNNPIGFLLSLILIPAVLGLLILLIWYLQCRSSKLEIRDGEILFEQGLLAKERSEVSTKNVRTVKVKQSVLNRIFGVGTVAIYTAGDSPEILANGFPDINRVSDLIKASQKESQV